MGLIMSIVSDSTTLNGVPLGKLELASNWNDETSSIEASLASLLDGDYTEVDHFMDETHRFRTAMSISSEVANFVIDDAQRAIGRLEASVTILDSMFAAMLEICRDDGFLASRGLRAVNASCRFSETASDEIRRIVSEGRRDAERMRVEFENGQAVLRYANMAGGAGHA